MPKAKAHQRITNKEIGDAIAQAIDVHRKDGRRILRVILSYWVQEIRKQKICKIPILGRFRVWMQKPVGLAKGKIIRKQCVDFSPTVELKYIVAGNDLARYGIHLGKRSIKEKKYRPNFRKYMIKKPKVLKYMQDTGRLPSWYVKEQESGANRAERKTDE